MQGYSGSNVKSLATICGHFEKNPKEPGRTVPEKELQAWMIREALLHNLSLRHVLKGPFRNGDGSPRYFDDILFALDEVQLGDKYHPVPLKSGGAGSVRCDMLCVGIKDGTGYPILVELKSERQLRTLMKQLGNFASLVMHDDGLRKRFECLLQSACGRENVNNVDASQVLKSLVWPAPETQCSQDTLDTLTTKGKDVAVFEYWKASGKYELRPFSAT